MLFPKPVGPSVNDAAPFSPEMVQGAMVVARPHRGKESYSVSQTTQVDATFSQEMVAGARVAPSFHISKKAFSVYPPDVIPFPYESTFGWRTLPVLPRLDRRGWSVAQTTHVSAPFSVEMTQGWAVRQVPPVTGKGLFTWMDNLTVIPPIVTRIESFITWNVSDTMTTWATSSSMITWNVPDVFTTTDS